MRDYTNRLLTAAEEGIVSWEKIARIATDYMSEAQIQDMCESDFSEVCPEEDFDDDFFDNDEDEDEDDASDD